MGDDAWSRVGWLDDPSFLRRGPPMTETTRASLVALERAIMLNQLLIAGSSEVIRSARDAPRVLTYVDDEVGCGLGCRFMRVTAAFEVAIAQGALFTFAQQPKWYFAGSCALAGGGALRRLLKRADAATNSYRGHECYFLPVVPHDQMRKLLQRGERAVQHARTAVVTGCGNNLRKVDPKYADKTGKAVDDRRCPADMWIAAEAAAEAHGHAKPWTDTTWTRLSLASFIGARGYSSVRQAFALGGWWHRKQQESKDASGAGTLALSGPSGAGVAAGRRGPSGSELCFATARALAFLVRPRRELEASVRAELARVPSPFVAMHVRHGDKIKESKTMHGLGAYVKAMRQRHSHVTDVWLMTEDEAVIRETAAFPDLTFHYTNTSRTNQAEHGKSEAAVDAMAINSLVNMYVAADADGFVGTLSSNWGRLVVMLSWGKYGNPMPCASLDGSFQWNNLGFAGCTSCPCDEVYPQPKRSKGKGKGTKLINMKKKLANSGG